MFHIKRSSTQQPAQSNVCNTKQKIYFMLILLVTALVWGVLLALVSPVQADEPNLGPQREAEPADTSSYKVFSPTMKALFEANQAALPQRSVTAALNNGLNPIATWNSNTTSPAQAAAWGDMDGDGDLDLAVANNGEPNYVYENQHGQLSATPVWESRSRYNSTAVAWGDMDGDGDLDLAVANEYGPLVVYANIENRTGQSLNTNPHWQSRDPMIGKDVMWGDMDGDGDLDLVTALYGSANFIYLNDGTGNFYAGTFMCTGNNWGWGVPSAGPTAAQSGTNVWGTNLSGSYGQFASDKLVSPPLDLSGVASDTVVLSWWQWLNSEDGFDYASVAVSKDDGLNWETVYGPVSGAVNTSWGQQNVALDGSYASSAFRYRFQFTSDGEVNSEGFYIDTIELRVGPTLVYSTDFEVNSGGFCGTPPEGVWQFDFNNANSEAIDLSDVDDDGDLDIAVANYLDLNSVYLNQQDGSFIWDWDDFQFESSTSIALGDVDNDGDADLAVGNYYGPNQFYLNENGWFGSTPVWTDTLFEGTRHVTWGDINNDGYLDLVVSNDDRINERGEVNRVYHNQGGTLPAEATWVSNDTDVTTGLAVGDVDNDGDLDVAAANRLGPIKVYHNESLTLNPQGGFASTPENDTWSVAWGDVDGDGDLDLAVGNFYTHNVVYENVNGFIDPDFPLWQNEDSFNTAGVAWGDVDGDGDLDLAVANRGQANQLYLNDNGNLQTTPVWTDGLSENSWHVAWADIDNDGDLDLAFASEDAPNAIYRNEGGTLIPHTTLGTADDVTLQLDWGDVDGDGDLDLALANFDNPNHVYINEEGRFRLGWRSAESDYTQAIAWGDVDGDGDLDLAVGNGAFPASHPNRVYLNEDGSLTESAVWSSLDTDISLSVAWGDVDGDGDLDLAVGNQFTGDKIYRNDGGSLENSSTWQAENDSDARSIAWGDVNGDGRLDLAGGHDGQRNLVYYNQSFGDWQSPRQAASISLNRAVAPADFLATETLNDAGVIPFSYTLFSPGGQAWDKVQGFYSPDGGGQWLPATATTNTLSYTLPAASGYNFPADGFLPQVITNYHLSYVSIPQDITLADLDVWVTISHTWNSDLTVSLIGPDGTRVNLFGSLGGDGDGFFHTTLSDQASQWIWEGSTPFTQTYRPYEPLSVFNGQSISGTWWLEVTDSFTLSDTGELLGWGLRVKSPAETQVYQWDVLESGFFGQSDNVLFRLEGTPSYRPQANQSSRTYQAGQFSTHSYPFRVRGSQIRVMSGTVAAENALVYQLDSEQITDGQPFARNTGEAFRTDNLGYLSGRGQIKLGDQLVALMPASESTCQVYRSTDLPLTIAGDRASRVQAFAIVEDNFSIVDVNVLALSGTHSYVSDLAFSLQSPAGTSVQLWNGACGSQTDFNFQFDDQAPVNTPPCPPTDGNRYQPLEPLAAFNNEDSAGVWTLTVADSWPWDGGQVETWSLEICGVDANRFITSAPPTPNGLDTYRVSQLGVQTLTVSTDNPLQLFDLDISLEWDATNDLGYLDQLRFDLERASQFIYDFSDGQVALGKLNVYQNANNWSTSHVVVQATNRLRPFAIIGGILTKPITDPLNSNIVYGPGQIRMGSTWNRYGTAGQRLGDDWPLILAHEFGHLGLFLEDTYLGFDDEGFLIPVDACTGSAMGDVYSTDNTEFIFDDAHWAANCGNTLPAVNLNRDEWDTLTLWYPWLRTPTTLNVGPSVLPLDLTHVTIFNPLTPTNTLEDPTFYLDYANGETSSSGARVFLQRDSYLIDLGNPVGGQNRIQARGAQAGDRLCIFDRPRGQFGCEVIEANDSRVQLEKDDTWAPLITLSPTATDTFVIQTANLSGGLRLQAQMYPEYGLSTDIITLTEAGFGTLGQSAYSGTFNLDGPSVSGHVQVWVDEPATESDPRREGLVAYSIGGNPGAFRGAGGAFRGAGGAFRGAGGAFRGAGGAFRGAGGAFRGAGAPLISPDGQMIFFSDDTTPFDPGDLYTVQNMASVPQLSAEKVVIGQGYNLVASNAITKLVNGSISFQYITNDILQEGVDEDGLKIHFWGGSRWEVLDTRLDAYNNVASAPSRGPGIYALLAGVSQPSIAQVTPNITTNDISQTLTLQGQNFLPPTQLILTSQSIVLTLTTEVESPQRLQATLPSGLQAQAFTVKIINGDGGTGEASEPLAVYDVSEACFYDFFESGPNKFTLTGDWGIVSLADGNQAMTDSPNATYNHNQSSSITTQAIDLSACDNPLLRWQHDYVLANLANSQDVASVEISTDGGATWTRLAQFSGGGVFDTTRTANDSEWANPAWQAETISLSDYSAETAAQLRFTLTSDGDVSDRGWLLDELLVVSNDGSYQNTVSLYLPLVLK